MGAHLVALVRAGAKFNNGDLVERSEGRSPRDRKIQSTTLDDTSQRGGIKLLPLVRDLSDSKPARWLRCFLGHTGASYGSISSVLMMR